MLKHVAVAVVLLLALSACGDDNAPTPNTAEVPSWAKVAPEQIAEAKKHGVPVAPLTGWYLAEVRTLLREHPVSDWVDLSLDIKLRDEPKRGSGGGWPERLSATTANPDKTAVSDSEVLRELRAAEVVIVSDIHTCRLHQAAYFTLLASVMKGDSQPAPRFVLALEALRPDAVGAGGRLARVDRVVLASSGFPIDVLERGVLAAAASDSVRLQALSFSRFRERLRLARMLPKPERPTYEQVSHADMQAVNKDILREVLSLRRLSNPPRIWILVGVGHVHAAQNGLAEGLSRAGVRTAIVHPYVPSLFSSPRLTRHLFRGHWARVGTSEFLAPVPVEVLRMLDVVPR